MMSKFIKTAFVTAALCAGMAATANAHTEKGQHHWMSANTASGRGATSSEHVTTGQILNGYARAPMELARGIVLLPGRAFGTLVHLPTTTYQVVRGERSLFTPAPAMPEQNRLAMFGRGTRSTGTASRGSLTSTMPARHYEPPV